MSQNYSATNPLRFKEHAMVGRRFSATRMEVIYGRHLIYNSVGYPGSRPEVIITKTPAHEARDPSGSGTIGLRAFEGPLKVKWHSLDDEAHEVTLNLADIFKDRLVPHKEDPAAIDQELPFISYGPTIVIEVNDRTLSIYMDVGIYLRPADPKTQARIDRRNRTLAYSKTF